MIRAMFGRAECETGNKHPKANDMGKWTCWALMFAFATVVWLTFKQFEPAMFPVVERFEISRVEARENNRAVTIYGSFDKVRDCEFVEIVAYSGPTFVRVQFMDNSGNYYPEVTRRVRKQNFGPWELRPKTSQLELYATHRCWTGLVTTELFKGALVL